MGFMRLKFGDRDVLRRVRYLAIAAVVTMLISFLNLLQPIDLTLWTAQSKFGQNKPSGDIVFVEVPDNVLTEDSQRQELRDAILELSSNGAKAQFIDLSASASEPIINGGAEELRSTLENTPSVYVVGRVVKDRNDFRILFPPRSIIGNAEIVVADEQPDYFGFVWRVPLVTRVEGELKDTFAKRLAEVDSGNKGEIEIDYRFDVQDFPVIQLDELSDRATIEKIASGRSFVFGYATAGASAAIDLPGSLAVHKGYVAIFAAETVMDDGYSRVGRHNFDYLPFLGFSAVALLLGILIGGGARRLSYGVVALGALFVIVGPFFLAFRTGASSGFFFVAFYGARCLIYRWRSEITLDSEETGLPTLQRLERDIAGLPETSRMVLVAAKIHNFSEVMATLPSSAKAEYFDGIVKRLRVGDSDLTVYSNNSDRLLWLQEFESQETVRSHLVALLAIFKNPLRLNDKPIDISITFGADFNFIGEAHRRISLAEALTDKTSLSAQPIIFGDEPNTTDEEWRVSLQSKIDAALESDEIFPVFQPQVDIRKGSIVGFEGLVRWNDSERGFISPSYFVEQCEQAGRMEKLQQFMLRECIARFQASNAMQTDAWLSINVSATLLADTWLTELVAQVLEDTGFPADRLVLEITETARVHDHKTAFAVLSALSNLGVGLSLDDFGTGSAGLESFYRLPFTELKIDRLFTATATTSEKSRAIIQNTINLGRQLGVRVICEGVEDQETLTILESMGCDFAQGYLFGKPFFDLNSFENNDFGWLKIS